MLAPAKVIVIDAHPDPKINVQHPRSDIQTPIQHVLKNTLGFGGINAALVFSRGLGE